MKFSDKVLKNIQVDLDSEVERWHLDKDGSETIYEFLGVTFEEYKQWLEGDKDLEEIIKARKKTQSQQS